MYTDHSRPPCTLTGSTGRPEATITTCHSKTNRESNSTTNYCTAMEISGNKDVLGETGCIIWSRRINLWAGAEQFFHFHKHKSKAQRAEAKKNHFVQLESPKRQAFSLGTSFDPSVCKGWFLSPVSELLSSDLATPHDTFAFSQLNISQVSSCPRD